jgi:hypothetical protein
MLAARLTIPVTLVAGLALAAPAFAQEAAAPSGEDLCAPKGLTIPFEAAAPRAWNTWVSNIDLKDRDCGGVAVTELRSRAKKNAQGELETTFKVTTFTKPGHDKKVTVTIEVLASDRVLKSTKIEAIDAEEKKNGHGSGYLSLPVDMIQNEPAPRLRISLEVVND